MAQAKSPNIIFIMTDQHRYDYLGCMGHPVLKTPHLDRLAEASVVFDSAYCSSPVCGPARAGIFTGMYPAANGVVRNHICVSSRRPLLTDRLSQAGYFNAMIGKLHLSPAQSRHGFDYKELCDSPHAVYEPDEVVNNPYRQWIDKECFKGNSAAAEAVISESEKVSSADPFFWLGKSWCDDPHHITTWTGNRAVEFIRTWKKESPLFLNVSFFAPHHPYSTCEPWDSLYDPEAIELPPTLRNPGKGGVYKAVCTRRSRSQWPDAVWRAIIARYMGAITQIDREIGRIVEALKNAGIWDNSVIVFTADHGDELGDFGFIGKDLMNEGSARIPLLVKPAGSSGGFRRSEAVNSLDLFATFLEIAGYTHFDGEADAAVESRSLLPLFSKTASAWDDRTFAMHGMNPDTAQAMIRKGDLKLVRLERIDQPPCYALYDLNTRVPDVEDRFDDPAYRVGREELTVLLESWWTTQLARYPDNTVLQRLSVRKLPFVQ